MKQLTCPACGQAQKLDPRKASQHSTPNGDGVVRTGYRTECEPCGEPFAVSIVISNAGTPQQEVAVSTRALSPLELEAEQRNRLADQLRKEHLAAATAKADAIVKGAAEAGAPEDVLQDLRDRVVKRELNDLTTVAMQAYHDEQDKARAAAALATAGEPVDVVAALGGLEPATEG